MAFSFNPGQIQTPGAPQEGVPGVAVAPNPFATSPILVLREKDGTISPWAWAQLLLIVFNIVTVVVCAVLFGYTTYLTKSIDSKRQELLDADATFKDYPFKDMHRLSSRMSNLDKLLKNYVSIRSPLTFLERVVENQVVFDEFNFGPSLEGGDVISFVAVTGDYRSLVQQLDALNLTQFSKVVKQPKVNGFKDDTKTLRIKVTTPVYVQGLLPGDVDNMLIPPLSDSSATSSAPTP